MRSRSFALLLLGVLPAAASSQTGSRSTVVLTILGGAGTGHSLWSIPKQPLTVLGTANHDTLALSRSISSSVILGASGTYFVTPSVGLHAELSYLGLPIDNTCTLLPPKQADAEDRNQELCDNLSAQAGAGGAIAIFVGVTVRATARRAFSPYVRGSIGLVNVSRSMVEVVGTYVDATGTQDRQVIFDTSPRHRSLMAGIGLGFTTPLGTGYQARLEVRDVITSLERVTGPANDLAVAPKAARTYHHFGLVLGFDIVLERARGRRY